MSTIDHSPSNNGRGSKAWSQPWTHFSVDRRSPAYCRVTFDHPPINTITATTVAELAELVGLIEEDQDLNVIVPRRSASRRSAGVLAARGASSCSPVTCGSPRARTRCSARSRSETVWLP
jgi:hypothetical protein